MYAIYDTWDNNIHWYLWQEISSDYSWGVYGFNILEISFSNTGYDILARVNPVNGGTINGTGSYNYGETANLTAVPNDNFVFIDWTENDLQVSTDPNYSFAVTSDRKLCANFNRSVSIDAKEKNITFNIYPNPTKELINIEIGNAYNYCDEVDFVLYDYSGKGNKIENYTLNQNTITLSISDKISGIYYLRISINGKECGIKKVVIIKNN